MAGIIASRPPRGPTHSITARMSKGPNAMPRLPPKAKTAISRPCRGPAAVAITRAAGGWKMALPIFPSTMINPAATKLVGNTAAPMAAATIGAATSSTASP